MSFVFSGFIQFASFFDFLLYLLTFKTDHAVEVSTDILHEDWESCLDLRDFFIQE